MLNLEQKKKLLKILKEDMPTGDVTSSFTPKAKATAQIIACEDCTIAGIEEAVFLAKSKKVIFKAKKKTGVKTKKSELIAELSGENRNIFAVERTILNVLGRMSAVATISEKAVKLAGKTKILLTRKTMPGFNEFDKKACVYGGALPHRKNLSEMILLKENHLEFFASVTKAVSEANKRKEKIPLKKAEVEVRNMKEAIEAVYAKADWIMLDNFSVKEAKKAVKEMRRIEPKTIIECSGGINLKNLAQYATVKADYISMGYLTKNAGIIDFSLLVKK